MLSLTLVGTHGIGMTKPKELGIESEPTEGVLAQEVLEVKPDAVVVKRWLLRC